MLVEIRILSDLGNRIKGYRRAIISKPNGSMQCVVDIEDVICSNDVTVIVFNVTPSILKRMFSHNNTVSCMRMVIASEDITCRYERMDVRDE